MQKINIKSLLRLSKNKKVRDLHIILCDKSLNHIGEISNVDEIIYHPQLMSSDELSFSVHKHNNGVKCTLWSKIRDFKVVYVKEYDEYFSIKVDKDESNSTTKKKITATSLCEAELSQSNLKNIEINTESDIARDNYTEPTVFYNPDAPNISLLNRILEKQTSYTIKHVDDTLKNIQRSFSVDGTSIYDFMINTLSQEIGCLFLFNSTVRGIYVYDLQTTCLDCGYRSEDSFTECPECGCTTLHEAYGTDTKIYIDKTHLGNAITLTSNTDSVKTAFCVSGGDDTITSAVKNINPNGSNYIYYFNDDFISDMPEELVSKINSYNELCDEYENTKVFTLKSALVSSYNEIIAYINGIYPDSYNQIQSSYTGFSNIMQIQYDVIDMATYLTSGMMPTWEVSDKTAQTQLALLNTVNLSPVAVKDASDISIYTANSSVLAMAKAIIDTSMYKVDIVSSSLSSQTWTGRFKITSRSDENDVAENTSNIIVQINDDYTAFVNQQIERAVAKVNDQGLKDLFDIDDLEEFKIEAHKYALNRLYSYQSAYQTAINILTDQKISSESSDLYESMYLPYYNRYAALASEISYRGSQIDVVNELSDSLAKIISDTHDTLNFENYIGTDLWKLFRTYVREDDYTNENYISDGLDNAGIIAKAKELINVAKSELVKSGTKSYSISATIQNLLLMVDENGERIFENLLDDFTLGNFIKCKIDGELYSMRLADITIDYSNLSELTCTFTDANKIGILSQNKVKELLQKVQTMSTSYSSVKKQAAQGETADYTLQKMRKEGLDSAQYNIFSMNSKIVLNEHGLLARNYDDVFDTYSDEQSRWNGCDLSFTTNNWLSSELAIGKQKYTLNGVQYEEYGVNANFVLAGKIIGGDIYSANYSSENKIGTHINLLDGSFSFGGDKLVYDASNETLSMKNGTFTTATIKGSDFIGGHLLIGDENKVGTYAEIASDGTLNAKGVNISGAIIATSGSFSGELKSATGVFSGMVTAGSIQSSNYLSGISGMKLNLTTGAWDSKYTKIDQSGRIICNNLISNNAIITGGTVAINSGNADYNYITLRRKVTRDDNQQYDIRSITSCDGFKISNDTNGSYMRLCDIGLFGHSMNGYNSIILSCSSETGKKDGLWIVGSAGNEVEIARDRIAMWYQPDFQKMTLIEKGKISIDPEGTMSWNNCAFSVYRGDSIFGGTVYTPNGNVETSDENYKNSIEILDYKSACKFIYDLKPIKYKLNDGTSNRYHHGFGAQTTKDKMYEDWGLYVEQILQSSEDEEEHIKCGLRYDEIISDLVATVQIQKKEIDTNKAEIELLKSSISAYISC